MRESLSVSRDKTRVILKINKILIYLKLILILILTYSKNFKMIKSYHDIL